VSRRLKEGGEMKKDYGKAPEREKQSKDVPAGKKRGVGGAAGTHAERKTATGGRWGALLRGR